MLTTLKLLLAAGLGAGYLSVAYLTAHPRVDPEYDAHYLHRVADCWVPLALRAKDPRPAPPASLEVAQLGRRETCRYLRLGWQVLGSGSVWSKDDRVTLNLPRRPGARAVEIMLRSVPARGPTIHVRFVLNGRTVEDDIAPGTTPIVVFPVPPEGEAYDPAMHITMDRSAIVATSLPNASGQPAARHVGIGLIAIRFLPAPPVANAGVYRQAL